MDQFTPRKAERRRVKLKMAISGPSGSGKTWNALALATNMWPGSRICVIDTENGSSELYAGRFEFDVIPLPPPYSTDRYMAAMQAVIDLKYDVLIIDQISHQWAGEGGILDAKEKLDRRPGSNGYMNWASLTPEHRRFMERIVQSPLHVIATMRAKQEYVIETNERGKQTPRKVGMAPVQREGAEYEFSVVFDLQADHHATVSKDRTELFSNTLTHPINLADKKVATDLLNWLSSAKAEEVSAPQFEPKPVSYASAEFVRDLVAIWREAGVPDDEMRESIRGEFEIETLKQIPQSHADRVKKHVQDMCLAAAPKAEEIPD